MIMFRSRDIVLVGMMLALAAFTYKVKYEEQKRHNQIRQIERQLQAEQDTINLLKAEWALISAPTRLGRLVEYYAQELELTQVDPGQIVTAQDLPQRLPDEIDMLISENTNSDPSLDLLLTGSMKP